MAGNKIYVQGSYIDVHDNENVYLSVDKAEVKVSENGQQQTTPKEVPEQLKSEAAEEIKEDLVDADILTADWQPLNLSGSERALVARAICERLKINEIWQVFGKLWGEKPETLRSYLNKALDQQKSLKFQDRLKNILG
jgi:hypothetical protein